MIVPLIVPFGSSGHRLIKLEDCPARSTLELMPVPLCAPRWAILHFEDGALSSSCTIAFHRDCLYYYKIKSTNCIVAQCVKSGLYWSVVESATEKAAKFSKSEEVENVCLCFLMWIYLAVDCCHRNATHHLAHQINSSHSLHWSSSFAYTENQLDNRKRAQLQRQPSQEM